MNRLSNPVKDAAGSAAHTPPTAFKHVSLAHGGGGQLSDELIREVILPGLGLAGDQTLLDSAEFSVTSPGRLAMTIDSYVVQPWHFPGGDVGRLAVCGTVNDLAVCGAEPMGLALSLIMPEGTPRSDLETVLESIAAAGREAEVAVVTGDTKVVRHQDADGFYITTAGVGRTHPQAQLSPSHIKPGDQIIVSGNIAEHGLAVMLAREMPEIESPLRSDAAPLNGLVRNLLDGFGSEIAFMRDPTRGGVGSLLVELAQTTGRRIVIEETALPISPAVEHAADMLGLDPLDIANEGKLVLAVRPAVAQQVIEALRYHSLGRDAALIGRVESTADSRCEIHTAVGGRRIMQKPYGEQLPRIC